MKKIIICHINVISVIKNTVVPFVVIGLVVGVLLGLFIVPANLGSSTLLRNFISTVLFMVFDGLLACVVLALAALLFNLICSFTGGLELEIKEKD